MDKPTVAPKPDMPLPRCPHCGAVLSDEHVRSIYGTYAVRKRKTNVAGPGRGHKRA